MRKEIREVPTVEKRVYYIADDGTEFKTQHACEDYEYKQERDKRKIQWYACESIADERPAKLWYIQSDEEFEWLKKTEWAHTYVDGKFSKEGWYIAIFHDNCDYRDEHEVYRLDEYIQYYQKKIQEIIDLTKS
jgi:hypothetical protein